MKRFLALALLLGAALLLATAAVAGLVFRHVDLRFSALLPLVLVPFLQAAVVLWVTGAWGVDRLAAAGLRLRRRPALLVLLALDAALLAAGWLFFTRREIGLAAAVTLQPRWAGLKALAAALTLTWVALRAASTRLRDRLWLLLIAGAVAALGVELFHPWLRTLPALVPGRVPTVIRWVAVYGGLFVAAMAALLHTGTVLARRSALAGFLVDWAAACATVVALVTVPCIYLRPFLVEPWLSVVRTGVSLALTGVLAAGLAALRPPSEADQDSRSR